ncbi:hypothetical protein ACTQV2_00920 [Bifidobacterium thermophilum]
MDARNTHTQPGTPASTPASAAHWAASLSNQSIPAHMRPAGTHMGGYG